MKKLALAASIALGLSAFGVVPATASGLGTTIPGSAPSGEDGSNQDSVMKEADLALKYREMTALEVTHGKGIEFTIDGLKKGDEVTTSLDNELRTAEKDGPYDGAVVMDEKPDDTNVKFTVTVERGDEPDRVFDARVHIIEGDRGDYDDGTLVMNPESTTLDESLYQEGLNLTMVNCSSKDEVLFQVFKKDEEGRSKVWEKSQLAGEDESASVRYMPRDGMPDTGRYEAVATCGDLEDTASVTVNPTEPQE
ncbi:hypothetical protein [Brevibacterium sp. RIT 803]|uniref:hypothetical protein n=1 Tax=Brevibacterium sp. RIT 803 TaxID=2810210 RepID=UPI0019518354|nr:hypothetical protein [Brevibacterium sp. RIT 803]MBM6591458.1 hypothetical protein [Brevibacterium sp. RIT 803]